MPVLMWIITLGSWNLFQRGFFSDFYDVQARALLHGHWNVPPRSVSIEGFVVKGHTFIYFGPFPSLIRIPILLFTSSFDGRLTQSSMLIAMLVALICTGRLGWKVRNLVSAAPVSVKEAVLVACSMVVVGLGSIFVFLASDAVIYNEAEAWGAALAIAAFDALVGFLVQPSNRGLAVTGTLISLDLLTRGSVGLGPVAAVGILFVLHGLVSLRRQRVHRRLPAGVVRLVAPLLGAKTPEGAKEADLTMGRRLAWTGIPDVTASPTRTFAFACVTLVPLGLYAAVNYVKFGSLFSVPFPAQVYARQNAALHAALAANGGSLLGLKFVPTALVQYLRPDALRTNRLFPFVGFPPPSTVIGHVRYDGRTWASSITSTMPAIVIADVVGLWAVFRPTRSNDRTGSVDLKLLRIPVAGAAVGILGSLAYAFIAERYLADWMPLLILAGLAGLAVVIHRSRSMTRHTRRALIVGGGALAVLGVLTNLALSILTQRELTTQIPMAARAGFVNFQSRIDEQLFGNPPPNVSDGEHLPGVKPAGSLAIIGDCTAMYQSNGLGWNPVELTAAAGHYRLTVSFRAVPGAANVYWPLVVTGRPSAGDYLAVRPVGHNLVSFAYLYQVRFRNGVLSQFWSVGTPVKIEPRHPYSVDVVLDRNIGQGLNVALNDDSVLTTPRWLLRAPQHVTFGVDTIGGPTVRTFPGRLQRLPLSPPTTCGAIRHRLRRPAR